MPKSRPPGLITRLKIGILRARGDARERNPGAPIFDPVQRHERTKEFPSMRALVLEAFRELVVFDAYLARGNFAALYRRVRTYPVKNMIVEPGTIERACASIETVSIWYWKKILCLQRSSATTCLLRKYGVPAEMVIGAQQMPFKAHAWVEVGGRVVNDKPYIPESYAALDRC
jgi:hypothetical protein